MTEEQKEQEYCRFACKGYQQTGKCFVDGRCEAFRNHFSNFLRNDK